MRFFFLGERLAVDLLNTVVVQDGRVHLLQGPIDVAAWAEAAGVLPHGALRGGAAGAPCGLAGVRLNPAPSTGGAGMAPVVVEAAGKLRGCCCSTRSRPIHTIRSPHMIASTG